METPTKWHWMTLSTQAGPHQDYDRLNERQNYMKLSSMQEAQVHPLCILKRKIRTFLICSRSRNVDAHQQKSLNISVQLHIIKNDNNNNNNHCHFSNDFNAKCTNCTKQDIVGVLHSTLKPQTSWKLGILHRFNRIELEF